MRHFYVRPDRRRGGIGRALAQQLIRDAHAIAPRLHLRATHAVSRLFWEAVGFAPVERRDRTHELIRAAQRAFSQSGDKLSSHSGLAKRDPEPRGS
jgi:GNAT superfamily N-acetyltransferase